MANSNNNRKQTEENFGQIEGSLSKAEQFFEDNKKTISIILAVIIIIVLAIFAIQKLYIQPKENKAQVEIYKAQKLFNNGDYEKALSGDDVTYLGFEQIADEYKITKTGKMARYYMGICNLHLGEYQKAIDNLKKFKSNDYFVYAMSKSAMGDAYVELKDYSSAINCYKRAANIHENDLTTPEFLKKLAITYELAGDNKSALATYQEIVDKYPSSTTQIDAKKAIGRLQEIK